jgi:nicotinate-nucleotide adenylyltransferase
MRIGFFGGSFDPVHNGHLALARACGQQAALDEVWFTPTAVQPLKQRGPQASNADRLAMLELAISSEPTWRVCRIELNRGGVSYTVDTLRGIRLDRPHDELFIMLGSDTLGDVLSWREPEEIFRLARPLFVRRAGSAMPDVEAIVMQSISGSQFEPQVVEMPAHAESSTEIRRLVAAGKPIDGMVPPEVAAYIADHGLYK